MLEIRNLTAGYVKESDVLKGINLSIGENEVVGVIGQNGSGKSTLAKTILNLVPYRTGEITFSGKPITNLRSDTITGMGIGFFFQGGRIFPNLTVIENLEFAAGNSNKKYKEKHINELKELFELLRNGRYKLKASYLSGGEQHQLALAMVLINKPKLLILDEPSAGLSPMNIKSIYEAISKFRKIYHTTILLIEQNVSIAFQMSDKLIFLENGLFSIKGDANKDFEEKLIDKLFHKEGERK